MIVTGPPAAGKTTIARRLARELELPLIAKDDIKETLFDTLGTGDREWSRRLGRATFDVQFRVLHQLLEAGCSVVAEGNFSAAEALRVLPPSRVVQVFCSARPDLLLQRFAERADRHPGHLDDVTLRELGPRLLADEWRPLALPGAVVEVDTSAAIPDAAQLAATVRSMPM